MGLKFDFDFRIFCGLRDTLIRIELMKGPGGMRLLDEIFFVEDFPFG